MLVLYQIEMELFEWPNIKLQSMPWDLVSYLPLPLQQQTKGANFFQKNIISQVVQFDHLHLVMSFIASSNACTGLIVSLEKELAPLFEELRQVVEMSLSDTGFDVHCIFIITDTIAIQQSLDHNYTWVYVLKKEPLFLPYTKEKSQKI